MKENENTGTRKRTVPKRAFKLWSNTSWAIVYIFSEHPDKDLSLNQLYEIIRSLFLNMEDWNNDEFSRSAVRSSLRRFEQKRYFTKRTIKTKPKQVIYHITSLGKQVFDTAIDFRETQQSSCSGTVGQIGRLLRATSSEHHHQVALKSWREIIAFDSGWVENARITKIHLDPFIIKNIRSMIPGEPAKTPAKWLTYRGDSFTMQVSKLRSMQLWVKGADWKEELKDWLLNVPNLEEIHLTQIWNTIRDRSQDMTITREFHVTDPKLSEANFDILLKVNHNDGSPPTTLEFNRSHGLLEAEFGGGLQDVDNVVMNLSGQFAAAATYEHKFERKLADYRTLMKQEFDRRLDQMSKLHKQELEQLKQQLQASSNHQEARESEKTPDYII